MLRGLKYNDQGQCSVELEMSVREKAHPAPSARTVRLLPRGTRVNHLTYQQSIEKNVMAMSDGTSIVNHVDRIWQP